MARQEEDTMRRIQWPQLLIGVALLALLVGIVVFAERSSPPPNSGVVTIEVFGVVTNRAGTCAEIAPNMFQEHREVVCTHGIVLGPRGRCIIFGEKNFTPHFEAGRVTRMAVCARHGLHPISSS
jgi:hypothetical protein